MELEELKNELALLKAAQSGNKRAERCFKLKR